jgi:hypothetical protein
MKKILTLTVGLMIVASAAMASGLYLGFNDCASGAPATFVTQACTSNGGTAMTLIASIVLPHPMANFVSAGVVIDVQTTAATLPDWWRVDAGGCRPGAATVALDGTAGGAGCGTIWDGLGSTLPLFQAQVGAMTTPPLAPNRLRLNSVAAILAPTTLSNVADELGVCKLSISRAGTTTCTGCGGGAAMVLNEINFISSVPGAPVDAVINPAAPGGNGITFQNGAPNPGATPTANRTWGSIKALYR